MAADDKLLLAKNEVPEPAPREAADALGRAAVAAGELALAMRRAGLRTWKKHGDSPVSDADLAADALLRERLLPLAPGYGWVSEESENIAARGGAARRWVVDPIDGTRSFIAGLPDWSISAALVENGRPVAAALYAPETQELFSAFAGGGATRNGTPIRASAADALAAAKIAGPRSVLDRLAKAGVAFTAVPRIHSLALRFARAAAGEIDAAIASENARDWDLAAADLLVHEAGGSLTDVAGGRRVYDDAEARHPLLAAAGAGLHPQLAETLGRILAERTERAAGATGG